MENIAFIGAGRMATAIMTALLDKGYQADHIWATDCSITDGLKMLEERGARTGADNSAAIAWADAVFLCIKPQQMANLLSDIGSLLSDKLVVSIAAGVPLSVLANSIKNPRAIIRVMPNTPMMLGVGVSALSFAEGTDPDAIKLVEKVFSLCGQVYVVPEAQMDAVTALSGSGPAYFYEVVRILADQAVSAGMDAETALAMATGTMAGATAMLQKTGQPPAQLIDQVVSPGGTTIAALDAFAAAGLAHVLSAGFDAAMRRSAELSAQFTL
ncbi:MAG TPA: pyrroline-5-carboxylate reductase [Clostridiales bacterium]|nr:pyrroline-5-carboxylate reductase [Clostridiales bacterium]